MAVNFTEQQLNSESSGMTPRTPDKSLMQKINLFLIEISSVPLKEKLFFVQHLGLMVKTGISISAALKTLATQTKHAHFKMALVDIAEKVEKGVSLSQAMSAHKKIFGELFINMVEAGELSGKLESVLHEIFLQIKKEHKLLSKVKGALTYPIVILTAMTGIGIFLFVKIIPKMLEMFKEMNATLPLPTRILIAVSDAITQHGLIALIIAVIVVTGFLKYIHTVKGRYYFQLILLNMPVFGEIIKKINLARFARNISSLLKTDIMIIKSFQITASVLGNVHYRGALEDMAQQIKQGGRLNDAIVKYPKLFPPVVAQMVAIGEDTGELDTILIELAEFYEDEIDQVMEALPSLIEPILILFLGLGLGGIAVAILLPMFSLSSQV